MNQHKTQSERILDALQAGGKITPADALRRFGCFRLAARIADLRRAGHDIETGRRQTRTGARIAVYQLADRRRRRAA